MLLRSLVGWIGHLTVRHWSLVTTIQRRVTTAAAAASKCFDRAARFIYYRDVENSGHVVDTHTHAHKDLVVELSVYQRMQQLCDCDCKGGRGVERNN